MRPGGSFCNHRVACTFSIGLLLVACVTEFRPKDVNRQTLSAGVVDLLISLGPASGDGRTFCRGLHVGDGKIITASHCLPSLTSEIRVNCGLDTSIVGRLERFERHDEADIAWVQLTAAITCPITRIDLSEVRGVSAIWLASRYKLGFVPIRYEDSFTFQGRQTENCLDRGDSGAPAFVGPPDQQNFLPAVGILISGQPDCPAWQTVLKFSAVADWLAEV